MAENLKPAIRFAGFTDAWEQRRLGAIATEVNRNDPTSIAPIMMITANNGFIEQSERYAFNNAGESLKKYILLEKGELAYNHGASKLRPYGSCFALTNEENARIPFVYHCFDVGENDSEFVSIELNGADIEEQLRKIVSSGARMDGLLNISYEEYSNVMLKLPSIREQQTISAFFRSLDHLITLHQRKCDKLSNVKKSMLEKMFPKNGSNVPEIRFAGFTDAWEQRKVKDIFKVTRGYVLPATITSDNQTDDMPYPVYSSQTKDNGLMGFYKDYLYEDAITWTTDGANAGTVNYRAGKFYCTNVCGVLLTNEMIANQMISEALNNVAKGYVSYVGNPKLMNNVMAEIEILLPKQVEEQQKISELFTQLDHLITLHQRKLEKLQNIKKSCLEKMFV